MRSIILMAVIAALVASPALAGRNANGALVVHTNNAIAYTGSADYCASALPQVCEQLVPTTTKAPETEIVVVWFLAAFRPEADPAVTTIQFGIDHNLPIDQGYFERSAACGPGILELPDSDWPEGAGDGHSGNLVSFSTPVTQKVWPFYWFAVYGQTSESRIGTRTYPSTNEAKFVDTSNPPVEDLCARFGTVRWGAGGSNDCPPASNCAIAVTSPNGGENWEQGSNHSITWTSSQCAGPIRIDLLRDGIVCQTIAAAAPNAGSYGWIPQQCNGAVSGYRIQLTDLGSGRADQSNATFSIPTGSCQLLLESPNGDERFDQGSVLPILWGSTNCGGQVKIELIRNGAVCATINAGTSNDGSFDWIAQPCAGECGYKIRVTDLSSGLADETDGTFCIAPCVPVLSVPNGGESWLQTTVQTLTWSAPACGGSVRLELVRDGTVCATIAASTPNDGSHAWPAQACGGFTDGYRVRLTDLASGAFDESDAPFSIPICAVSVIAPNGGESWTEESAREILWTAETCGTEVKIELLRNGSPCLTISPATPNDGSFLWTAEQCAGATSGYTIRVTDLTTGVADASNAVFSIPDPPCQITVASPNGGESWVESTNREITWTSRFCGGTVKIDLIRAGAVCATISPGTANDGGFQWIAQRCGTFTTDYKIRITDLTLGGVDESDQPFTIPTCQPLVVFPNGGEEIPPGSSQTIQWNSTNCGGSVKIEILRNGVPCATLAESTPNDGSHPWTANMCGENKTGYKIRIRDLTTQVADESDAVFCIGCGEKYYFPGGIRLVRGKSGLEIPLHARNDQPLRSLAIKFCFDPAILQCVDLSISGTRAAAATSFTKSCAAGCAIATITFGAACPPQLDAGDGPILKLIVDVPDEAPLGSTPLDLIDATPAVNTMTPCGGAAYRATLIDGSVEISLQPFIRGDTDADGAIDIADIVACLAYQFADGPAPECRDAADIDDSGRIDIADCLAGLCAQFGDCDPPSLECVTDATADDPLDCASSPPCDGLAPPRERAAALPAGRIVIGEPTEAGGDTLRVPLLAETSIPLAGLQFEVIHDPAHFDLLGIEPAPGIDFLRARPIEPGRIRAGCIPDFRLERSLRAGTDLVGVARLLRVARSEGSSDLEVAGGRGVSEDRRGVELGGSRIELPLTPADPHLAARLALDLPNPIATGAEIRLTMPVAAHATIELFDIAGRRVTTLHDAHLGAGIHRIGWDASGTIGTGIYFVRASASGERTTRRTTVLR